MGRHDEEEPSEDAQGVKPHRLNVVLDPTVEVCPSVSCKDSYSGSKDDDEDDDKNDTNDDTDDEHDDKDESLVADP